jgi:hypothetical protein
MIENATLIETFNNIFCEFIDDIANVFPENPQIQMSKKTLGLVNISSPRTVIKIWYKHIYLKYKENIDSGDMDFFFNKDYSTDLSTSPDQDYILTIIDNVRDTVKTMNETNKNHISTYVQNLSKLSELYANNNA